MKLFEKIKIKKEHREDIKKLIKSLSIARAAFNTASVMLENEDRVLWKAITELYPEIKNYRINLDHDKLEITNIGKSPNVRY